ncbi:MAG TPA: tyrosine-type recombinase/integrase [Thermoanaerobaculales bacterium]|nr:tyrosine-type recombinase/integrase [Thermoanaerobaculales bacterium]
MVERTYLDNADIAALEAREKRYDVYDSAVGGLAVTVTPKGVKTFYMIRKVAGTVERIRIGRFPGMKIGGARKAAIPLQTAIGAGRNPAEERRDARGHVTIGELWKAYLERWAKPRKRSWRYDQVMYGKHLKRWAAKRADLVKPLDVVNLHERIAREGGPVAANRALALLSSMYSSSMHTVRVPLGNPCAGIRRTAETPRNRPLQPAELDRLLEALDAAQDRDAADAVRLMLFTGLRVRNVLGLRWQWINLRDGILRVPASAFKTKRVHTIPLPSQAVRVLKLRRRQQRHEGRSVWVFPGDSAKGHLDTIRGAWGRIGKAAKIEGAQLRDCRHTFATVAGAAGVPYEVIAHLLGHSLPGTTARYSHPDEKRLRVGMQTAADTIEHQAGRGRGATVVDIATGRGAR